MPTTEYYIKEFQKELVAIREELALIQETLWATALMQSEMPGDRETARQHLAEVRDRAQAMPSAQGP
jgi:hypothetical protein